MMDPYFINPASQNLDFLNLKLVMWKSRFGFTSSNDFNQFHLLVAFMTPGFIHRDGKPIEGQGWRRTMDEDSTMRRDEFK